MKEREKILEKSERLDEKNLDLEDFWEFYFEVSLIVRQPPLFNDLRASARKCNVASEINFRQILRVGDGALFMNPHSEIVLLQLYQPKEYAKA